MPDLCSPVTVEKSTTTGPSVALVRKMTKPGAGTFRGGLRSQEATAITMLSAS